jgi:hypothetical protein
MNIIQQIATAWWQKNKSEKLISKYSNDYPQPCSISTDETFKIHIYLRETCSEEEITLATNIVGLAFIDRITKINMFLMGTKIKEIKQQQTINRIVKPTDNEFSKL